VVSTWQGPALTPGSSVTVELECAPGSRQYGAWRLIGPYSAPSGPVTSGPVCGTTMWFRLLETETLPGSTVTVAPITFTGLEQWS
jgi:hypothetical protein